MRSLLSVDVIQLRRIDEAIAAFKAASAFDQEKKSYLLRALEHERRELLKSNPAIKVLRRLQVA